MNLGARQGRPGTAGKFFFPGRKAQRAFESWRWGHYVQVMTQTTMLPSRAVLAVEGPDRVAFLQGLVSNDVAQAAPGRAVWAALLTPQGKWLADFFIVADGARLLLDVEADQAEMIATRLGRFRLRSKVSIAASDLAVFAAWGGAPPDEGLVAPDPRLQAAGWRVLATALPTNATPEEYDRHRIALGLPDGSRDMEADKSILLEAGFNELHGIAWDKGCYMGQELTARTRYRGLVKRRLVPVRAAATLPPSGTPVLAGGEEVGVLRSVIGGAGLAVLRLAALDGALTAGGVALRAVLPDWIELPEPG